MKAEITLLEYNFVTHKWSIHLKIMDTSAHIIDIDSNLGEVLASRSLNHVVLNQKLICEYENDEKQA